MAKVKQVRVFTQKTVQIQKYQPMVVGVERTIDIDENESAAKIIEEAQRLNVQDILKGMELDIDQW